MPRKFLFLVLLTAILVNLLGALGPELGFDALWYHLTIPKIYLMWGKIDFIPGGLLYYSAMPRLGEMLYLGTLGVLGGLGEIGPHLINWGAGIGTAIVVYKIARKIGLSPFFSLLSSILFYCAPLVGWQSGSAYVDIIRTFFEALAFWFFINKKSVWTGVAVGLAISTKTLGLGSLGILGVLGVLGGLGVKGTLKMVITATAVCAPWFIWAYFKTGHPLYPIGAGILDATHKFGRFGGFEGLGGLMQDLVSPIYLIILPFVFLVWKKLDRQVLLYSLLAFIVWWLTPPTGGGRFLLPYLPVWAVLTGETIRAIGEIRGIGRIRGLIIGTALIIAVASTGYRLAANAKVIPYLLGKQTKTEYLCQHLDFSTRVFVDCTGKWAKKVKPTDLVLVKGFHNLYYVNFPFVHETWYKGEKVNYILDFDEWKK